MSGQCLVTPRLARGTELHTSLPYLDYLPWGTWPLWRWDVQAPHTRHATVPRSQGSLSGSTRTGLDSRPSMPNPLVPAAEPLLPSHEVGEIRSMLACLSRPSPWFITARFDFSNKTPHPPPRHLHLSHFSAHGLFLENTMGHRRSSLDRRKDQLLDLSNCSSHHANDPLPCTMCILEQPRPIARRPMGIVSPAQPSFDLGSPLLQPSPMSALLQHMPSNPCPSRPRRLHDHCRPRFHFPPTAWEPGPSFRPPPDWTNQNLG